MADERIRVTLTKAHAETATGRELIALLTELSADGNVTREEMERLRSWLEVDRGVDFAALGYLYEVVEQISEDGEVTEEELDRLALAIERVLPKELRQAAVLKRQQTREAGRVAQREARLQEAIADRAERRAAREAERARQGVLHRAEFAVRGAFRFAERREACERLVEGDAVTLEREPDSPHDPNAILVLSDNNRELGYVPREDAAVMAPLLDAGAEVEATVNRLWETPDDAKIVPIVIAKLRRGASLVPSAAPVRVAGASKPVTTTPAASATAEVQRSGLDWGVVRGLAIVVALLLLFWRFILHVLRP